MKTNSQKIAERVVAREQNARIKAINCAVVDYQAQFRVDHNTAFAAVRRAQPKLFATNNAPAAASVSADGQHLLSDGRPSPEQLHRMGLPQQASEESIRLYLAAEQAEAFTPHQAALAIKTLIQSHQLQNAMGFDEAITHVAKHFPEIWATARKATIAS